ncbi:3'-5' exonuclease [Paenibacillus sp. Marseille-Q9583]
MNEIITVIDVETTGLDPQHDHITEIAAIRAEVSADESIREIGRFQTFVAIPLGTEITPEITDLTGVGYAQLRGAPDRTYAALSLEFFIGDSTVIAHNAPFDLAFLCTLHPDNFACTRAMSRLVDPDESARLADVCTRYGVDLNGHHRAMNDVEATLQVYARLREKAEVNGIEYRNVVVDSAERPLTYTPPGAIVRTIERKNTKEAA